MKSLILCLLLIWNVSCSYKTIPKDILEKISFCYEEKNSGISNLIRIKGYYSIAIPHSNYGINENFEFGIDTVYENLMFYEDGLFITGFHDFNQARVILNNANIPQLFQEINLDKESKLLKSFNDWFNWGFYLIEGNIIKVVFIDKPRFGESRSYWYAYEIWYKILDKNTLIEVYCNPLHEDTISFNKNYSQKIKHPAKFVKTVTKPSPNPWLKKEPWFWCNEEDYKAYMKSLKK